MTPILFLLAAMGPSAEPLAITCTTQMIGDVVERIAGDRAEVTILIGEGIDPHLYKATRSDIGHLLKADAVFYNGLMLEGRMSDALVLVARKKPRVFAVSELLSEDVLLEPEEFNGHHDPHLWMSVRMWRRCAERVHVVLAAIDEAHAADYQQRFDAYAAELEALDQYVVKTLATIPAERRVLVTAHDAFNYLARDYGLEVIGIQGISTESEAGIEDINRIVSTLVRRGITAVFVETSVSEKNVRALVEGAAAQGHSVHVGGSLFSDAMGARGTYEGTYIGMIDHNITTIARALGGTAPPRGSQGHLAAE